MQRQFAVSQQPPFRQHQQPFQPQPHQVQAPMVYVYEVQRWEYKVVVRKMDEELPSEVDLNALGIEGWELAGTVTLATQVQFYFKRVRK